MARKASEGVLYWDTENRTVSVAFGVGDRVRYGGNWSFEGEVVRVRGNAVTVRADSGEEKCFSHLDIETVGESD